MVVLVLGSGGREHALAWKNCTKFSFKQVVHCSRKCRNIRTWGNVSIDPENFQLVAKFALEKKVEIIVVGPEGPLVNGINDYFSNDPTLSSITVIGPKKEGAILEGSKAFSKKFMADNNIPTAKYKSFDVNSIARSLRSFFRNHEPTLCYKSRWTCRGKRRFNC